MTEYNPLGKWIVDAPTRLEKLLIGDANPTHAHESRTSSAKTLSNGSSSMAVSISNSSDHETNSLGLENVPSLTQAMTAISISTPSSISASGSYHNTYHQNHGNVNPSNESSSTSAAAASIYQCGLEFLGCRRSFTNSNDCYTHSLTHFRNNPPPPTAQCPLCSEWSHTGPNAWAARSTHLAHHQSSDTLRLDDENTRHRRPDHSLYAYLLRIGVVGMMQYQELVRNHRTDVTKDAYVEFNNPGKDRRKRIAMVTTRGPLR